MISIKQKISRPFIIIVVAIPIIILVLFNVTLSFMVKAEAEENLRQAALAVEMNFRKFGDETKDKFNFIMQLARTTKDSDTTEIIIYNKNGNMSSIVDYSDSFIDEGLAEITYTKMQNVHSSEIIEIVYNSEKYYAIEVRIEGQSFSDKIVYISKGYLIDGLTNAIYIILFVVSIFVILVTLIISRKITKEIAKPIEDIAHKISQMNSDNLLYLDENQSSLELIELAKQVNKMNKRIYEYNKSQKAFLHNASHELRTPLMSIQGYAEGISQNIFKNTSETATIITEETKRLTILVDELLTLARVDNFDVNTKLNEYDLNNIVKDNLQKINGYALKKGKKIDLYVKSNSIVHLNDELFTKAFINIISNAIKYSESQINVIINKENSFATLCIIDDGKGIQERDLPYIFDRFYKGKSGSYGLGLSIAKSAIASLGGDITAENSDKGAKFTILLPVLKE